MRLFSPHGAAINGGYVTMAHKPEKAEEPLRVVLRDSSKVSTWNLYLDDDDLATIVSGILRQPVLGHRINAILKNRPTLRAGQPPQIDTIKWQTDPGPETPDQSPDLQMTAEQSLDERIRAVLSRASFSIGEATFDRGTRDFRYNIVDVGEQVPPEPPTFVEMIDEQEEAVDRAYTEQMEVLRQAMLDAEAGYNQRMNELNRQREAFYATELPDFLNDE